MHRDLLKSLVLLTLVRALCSAATPAPDPCRRPRRQPDGEFQTRSDPEPHDVTAPPRHKTDGSGGQSGSTWLTGAATPPSPSPPDDGTRPKRRTRRGNKSRRRGRRGGRCWLTSDSDKRQAAKQPTSPYISKYPISPAKDSPTPARGIRHRSRHHCTVGDLAETARTKSPRHIPGVPADQSRPSGRPWLWWGGSSGSRMFWV